MNDQSAILIVEDEQQIREAVAASLECEGFAVHQAGTAKHAAVLAAEKRPDLVVLDLGLPPDPGGASEGLATLETIRARWPREKLPAIVITGSTIGGHEDEAVTPFFHLLVKPVLPNKLRAMIAFKLGVKPQR